MKIANIFNNTNIYKKNTKKEELITKKGLGNDKIELSSTAKDYQSVLKAITKAPDIREEKINDIAKKMENKTYNVSTDDIINKMLGVR